MRGFPDEDFIKETSRTRRNQENRSGPLTGWETVIFELEEMHPLEESTADIAIPKGQQ